MKKHILILACNIFLVGIRSLQALPLEIEKSINYLVKNNPHQLSKTEYGLIAEILISKTPCNMLVFGVGRDSDLWIKLNNRGTTVFLEDNPMWLNLITQNIPEINAHLVTYNTQRNQWIDLLNRNIEAELLLNLPKEIMETRWDIIFVDAPAGWADQTPGRMKSISTAAKLAFLSKNCNVFVHDCDVSV